jgi:two-component system, chemotaxis family, CheB/CheR fusion protein
MKTKKPKPPISVLPPNETAPDSPGAGFNIVGIGASAGGLEAFEQFFRYTTADSGMAFVLVSHLDPNHNSLLTEILQRTTTMPVVEAQDQMQVEANHVYVIPPNRDMAIFHGKLQLDEPTQPRGQRLPIDAFFRSLAEDSQERAVGIVLSGTGTDGTLGLRAVVGVGGVTLVQAPATAKYGGMPTSAIQSGYVTRVLPVEEMPAALLAGVHSLEAFVETASAPLAMAGIDHVLMQLRGVTGHDFSQYKKSTIGRRIARRMALHAIGDTETYARYLKEYPAEVHSLFKELLINVTNFFRDSEAFIVLEEEILPLLCKDKPDSYVFRVWVAGCATGEEAYSIAILLHELMERTHQAFKVQIYGTDLAGDVIDIARAGVYPHNIAQDMPAERLRRYFVKEDAGYRVRREIRELVVFAVQNAIKDPPFTRLDLLSCRNVMIYMEPELQNRLIPTFHYALNPGGVLFLSSSESIGNYSELFSTLNRKWKFYRANHAVISSHSMSVRGLSWVVDDGSIKAPEETMSKHKETNFTELTRRALLQCYAPASVVVDLKGNIFYVYGETGKYLRPAPGQASLNIIEMAREGLDLELRVAVQTVVSGGVPTLNHEIQVKTNGGFSAVGLSVRPLPVSEGNQQLLLVSFQDIAELPKAARRRRVVKPVELSRIEELERDLAYQKESHQLTLEEQQATNEELKSTNEEIQSTNEELQSTNEELETSKEELQSINEELITVNSELQTKIEQLADMQNDMKNLLDSINVGIIFLDRHLLVRSFTREATKIYHLVTSDVGRPLNDIRPKVDGEDLLIAAKNVLETLIPYEREVQLDKHTWMLARLQPYRTLDNMIDGVVLTFADITTRVRGVVAEAALAQLEGIVNTVREPLVVLDGTLKVVNASRAFYQVFKVSPEDIVGRQLDELGNGQWDIPGLGDLLAGILSRGEVLEEYALEQYFPELGYSRMLLNARRIIGKIGDPQLVLLSIQVRP